MKTKIPKGRIYSKEEEKILKSLEVAMEYAYDSYPPVRLAARIRVKHLWFKLFKEEVKF
jgi:hypothetical protein